MKKFLLALLLIISVRSVAQNVQVLYDFGKEIYSEQSDRANVTITYEHYTVDSHGSWFYFVDLDVKEKGISCAYTEIARTFNVKNSLPLLHIEYNGGLNEYGSYANSFLTGIDYNIDNITLSALYRHEFSQNSLPQCSTIQITGVWNYSVGKFLFSGFVDVWRSYIPQWDNNGQKKGWIMLAEPQIWYNISNNIAVGSELRISNNFVYPAKGEKTFFINPTIAIKYNL